MGSRCPEPFLPSQRPVGSASPRALRSRNATSSPPQLPAPRREVSWAVYMDIWVVVYLQESLMKCRFYWENHGKSCINGKYCLVVSTYPSVKYESVGMMKFPTEWKIKFHVPVTTNQTWGAVKNRFNMAFPLIMSK